MLIIKHLIIILKISFVCYSFSGTELGPFLKKIKSDHNDWHTGHKNIWVKMLGKEYHVRNEPTYLNQANAKAYCKSQGGILFEPKSAQVNKNVAKFAKDTIGNWKFWIWLGIHYTNGQFVYESDDKSIVWNNWKSTQPNGDGNCVALETINYKWGDVGCNETWYIYEICEREIHKLIHMKMIYYNISEILRTTTSTTTPTTTTTTTSTTTPTTTGSTEKPKTTTEKVTTTLNSSSQIQSSWFAIVSLFFVIYFPF